LKPSKTVNKKRKNVNRSNEQCQFDWHLCQKCFDTHHYGRIAENERRTGPKTIRNESCLISKERFTKQ
jgi:hypothetical protein